ncbi:hypothetical protein BLTE_02690 [Blastochloris tepida]|uniref:FHA domain-containing protein n=1 Tax=Blastochloris tepida TaxID=2233851 RepID=A0A348FWA1_9HYPH|nr:hypothetical protein BLTE_02690 [Blastochloris tepida]
MESSVRGVLFRHISGSRANRIDKFDISENLVIHIGRKAGSEVLYDAVQDDLVSREHAVVTLVDPENLIFTIKDAGSSNGTYVNGVRISEATELFPDDTVELGKDGPKFVFDIQPRPEGYAGKTRVMSAVDTAVTRMIPRPAGLDEPIIAPMHDTMPPPKPGVGKETVERMLVAERSAAKRSWIGIGAGLGAAILIVAGGLYWNAQRTASQVYEDAQAQIQQHAEEIERAKTESAAALTKEIGTTSREIVEKWGDSTVKIEVSWGLYDQETGKPLLIKTLYDGQRNLRPCFILTRDNTVVPWLTLEDEFRTNKRVFGRGMASGFVVSENGFILTNKHVAAPWMTRYEWPFSSPEILLIPENERLPAQKHYARDIVKYHKTLDDLSARPGEPRNWVPEQDKGIIFANNAPIRISRPGIFAGRIEELLVRFPLSRLGMSAQFVRASTDADAALIKIETPQALTKVDIAEGDDLVVGDRVTVLGYPAVSIEDKALLTINEAGSARTRAEDIPQPTVTEGIISRVGSAIRQEGSTLTTFSNFGDAFQLSINTTGAGNSGGPVFNRDGKVIGLFTYGRSLGDIRVSLAVPIKHGRALLQAQRSN